MAARLSSAGARLPPTSEEEECRPQLLTVDLQRPRANSDPGATFCVPEITVEDFSGGEGGAGGEGNAAPGTFYRPRANTCPEDMFRARKGRPPTPPPMGSPRGTHVVYRTPSKERVSFVHHKLSKVTEDGGETGSRGRQFTASRPGTSRLSAFTSVSLRRHSQPGPSEIGKLCSLRSDPPPQRLGFAPPCCQPSEGLPRRDLVSGSRTSAFSVSPRRVPLQTDLEPAPRGLRREALPEGSPRSSLKSEPLPEDAVLPATRQESAEGELPAGSPSSPLDSPGSFRARDCRFNPCRLVGDGTHLQAC